ADEPLGLCEHLEELSKVLAEDKETGLANLAGLVIALALGEYEEMIPVRCFLHLSCIGARANRFEKPLEEDLRLGLGPTLGRASTRYGRSGTRASAGLWRGRAERRGSMDLLGRSIAGRR